MTFIAILSAFFTVQLANAQYDVPYVATPQEVVEEMLKIANVTADDYVIDLGSGDGRIVITAAKKYGARALGVEIDPDLVEQSKRTAREAGVADRVDFIQADLFQTDIREATVVTMYLLYTVNLRLRPRLLTELAPGTRIVSHDFSMGEWKADETRKAGPPGRERMIYYWVIPARVEGAWEMIAGTAPDPIHLTLSQKFQHIEGSAHIGDQTRPLRNARLMGDRISFDLHLPVFHASRRFEGRVDGDVITGTPGETAQPSIQWRARRN